MEIASTQRPLWEITAALQAQRKKYALYDKPLAADAGMNLILGDLHELNEHRWGNLRNELKLEVNRWHRMKIEPWRRVASGFMCLFFCLRRSPLGDHSP